MKATMRNAMLAAGAMVLAATTAGATPSTIFEGDVPVPFVVNGTMFPAGRYMVQRESSSVLLIRGEKKNHAAAFIETLRDPGLIRGALSRRWC